MQLKMYQIDAFTDKKFSGNPAAVCPLETWLDDALMQNIAIENNLSETAFFVPEGDGFGLRWFTPGGEVKLCGHATLASAFVLFEILGYDKDKIIFNTLSGPLYVSREENGLLCMDFPAQSLESCAEPQGFVGALGSAPCEILKNDDIFAVFENEEEILTMRPDFNKLAQIPTRGICVTAPGRDSDFVSRFFAPSLDVNEDPVTGSAHCTLTPFWAQRLGKGKLTARQVSRRGGTLYCTLEGNRVLIAGSAVKFMEAVIDV